MNKEALLGQLDQLIVELVQARDELVPRCKDALALGSKLREACRSVEASSANSWVGWHSRMYYGDFGEPPIQHSWSAEWGGLHSFSAKWHERSLEELQAEIEQRSGAKLSDLGRASNEIREACEPLHQEVMTVIAPIADLAGLATEQALVKKIEAIKWIVSPATFMEGLKPATLWSRDTEALSQGAQAPLHLNVEVAIVSNTSTIAACRDFLHDAIRVARQVRTKLAATPDEQVAATPTDVNRALARSLRYRSIILFTLIAAAVIASLVYVLRRTDLGTLADAAIIVGGAFAVAGMYALLVDRGHARWALVAGGGTVTAIAAIDQALSHLT